MIKIKILKPYKALKAGEIVDGIMLDDGIAKIFHSTGWYALTADYFDYSMQKSCNEIR